MTRINKIVMQGFKSFAKRTEIPFGPRFNVVLGPNGSGKSNITDAICFVLGKLSAKGLRAEKQANLIYDGGKTNTPAKYAEVAIHFDNSNKTFPYPEQEVVISRRVLPTGNSIYKINGKTCSRKEIIDLLGLAKINPNGYNIILQGDIAQFVEMSTESRRQIIEEIADITLYEDKKRQALLELGKVEEKLKEAKIVLAERKTYLEELKTEHDQALKYRDMRERIDRSKATYLHLHIQSKKEALEALARKFLKLTSEIEADSEKIKEIDKKISELRSGIEQINREIEHKGEKGQVQLHKSIENLRVELSTNTARIESCKEELNKIKQRREGLERQKAELDERIEALSKEAKTLDEQKEGLNQEKTALEEKLKGLRQRFDVVDSAKVEKRFQELDNECEVVSNSLFNLRTKQQELLRKKDALEIQINNLKQRIEKIAELEATNKKGLQVLKQVKTRFKQVTVELSKRLNEDSAMASRLSSLRDQLITAREELAKLKEKKVSLTEKISGNIAIKKVLELGLPSVYGTVSSLGSVKSEYALALDVAAGSHLKDIVVENEAVAVKCIKYLKKNKLGVATFLPLNKIRAAPPNPRVRTLLNANGVHGLATELIDFNPKFKPIFGWVFRDTIVVENIDVAKRLGIGSARMVTLDGDLMGLSGAMIGGFRRTQNRSLGFQEEEVSKHLSDVEVRAASLTKQVEILEREKLESEEAIVKLKHEKAELEAEIIKRERSLHLESEDLEASNKEREVLAANLNSVDKQLAELQREISKQTGILTSKKIEKEKLKQKLAIVRDTKLLAEINSYEEKIRQISEEMIGLEGAQKNNRIEAKEVFGKELARVIQVLKQLDKEEAGFKEEIAKRASTHSRLEKQLRKMEKQSQAFYSKYKELFKKRNTLNDKLRELEVKKTQINEQIRQTELKRNSLSLDKATLKAQLAGFEEEFKQFDGVELLSGKSMMQLKREIDKYEALVTSFGSVNLKSLEIYEQVEKEYKELQDKREKLLKEKEDVERMMHEIELKKKGLFLSSFEKLDSHFQSFFARLSAKGGEAHLALETPENPFDGGVEIKVKRAGKRYVDLRSLSGGEMAMTALALIFAIQEYEPATFYIMDEVEAALDKQNSEKLAKLIKAYSEKAQYIVISHNDYIVQEADTLFGVSMSEHGISKVVSLRV